MTAQAILDQLRGPARQAHPAAWWAWAMIVAIGVSQTTNLALLGLIAVMLGWVVLARRPATATAGISLFIRLAVMVVAIRVVMQCLLVGSTGATVWFRLPEVPLPDWLAGIRLGGPVTTEAVLAAVTQGLRLAVLLLCFAAANTLAAPTRLLRYLPRGLQAAGVAVTVSLSAADQLALAYRRIRRARQLRGLPSRGFRGGISIAAPVLEEALDRALTTAAALDARGYGRQSHASRRNPWLLLGPGITVAGLYLLLDDQTALGLGLLTTGLLTGGWGLRQAGAQVVTTRYRPDPWAAPEWAVMAAASVSAALIWTLPLRIAQPDPWQLQTPLLSAAAVLAVAVAATPGWLTPHE